MKFLGIDLGWQSGASGLCCLNWHQETLHLEAVTCHQTIEAILAWIERQVGLDDSALVAVDAPTIIPNATGMRSPDRLTHKLFGHYHAGCYPANLSRPFAQRTVLFGRCLEHRGFAHAPEIVPHQLGRYQIEVFPHPAIVHLFQLDRILKYKKGKLAQRQRELARLYQYIFTILPQRDPPLSLTELAPLAVPEVTLTSRQLKALEDRLDSLICAYVAAHWWCWGTTRNWVLGDRHSGYIVVPAPVKTM